jgi:molybdenum-dependent DNA-binding transcriptional regulator ModE
MLDLNKAYGVLHAISQTGSIEGAAALCGISATTYYNWLRHGRRMAEREAEGHRIDSEDQLFASLYRNISETLAHLESRNFEIVQRSAKEGVWQAAAWILERRFPARWGRRNPWDKSPVSISTQRVTVSPPGENRTT